ncbi:hypothetical protein Pelo_15443 [Pelomyxa schiedti]|nr:hypothetical protein Pelo_15443 [Pelomyxa schiedti]
MYIYVPLVYTPPPPPPPALPRPSEPAAFAASSSSFARPSPGSGSWDVFGSISRIFTYSSELCEKGIGKVSSEVKQAARAYSDSVFRSHFRLPPQEEFLGEFWCRGLSGGHVITVTIFLSTNYFGFLIEYQGQKSTVMFPMRNIVSWQRAVQTRHRNGLPTFVIDLSASKFDAVQIYTDDFRMHVFYGFYHFEKFCHTFDSTWRAAKRFNGPLPHHNQHRRCNSDSSFPLFKPKLQSGIEQSKSCTDVSDEGSHSSQSNHTSDADNVTHTIHCGTTPSPPVSMTLTKGPNMKEPSSTRLLVQQAHPQHTKRKTRAERADNKSSAASSANPSKSSHKRSLSVDSVTSTKHEVKTHRKQRRTNRETNHRPTRQARSRLASTDSNTESATNSSSPPPRLPPTTNTTSTTATKKDACIYRNHNVNSHLPNTYCVPSTQQVDIQISMTSSEVHSNLKNTIPNKHILPHSAPVYLALQHPHHKRSCSQDSGCVSDADTDSGSSAHNEAHDITVSYCDSDSSSSTTTCSGAGTDVSSCCQYDSDSSEEWNCYVPCDVCAVNIAVPNPPMRNAHPSLPVECNTIESASATSTIKSHGPVLEDAPISKIGPRVTPSIPLHLYVSALPDIPTDATPVITSPAPLESATLTLPPTPIAPSSPMGSTETATQNPTSVLPQQAVQPHHHQHQQHHHHHIKKLPLGGSHLAANVDPEEI